MKQPSSVIDYDQKYHIIFTLSQKKKGKMTSSDEIKVDHFENNSVAVTEISKVKAFINRNFNTEGVILIFRRKEQKCKALKAI